MAQCQQARGWVSRGRNASAPPPPPVPGRCADPGCAPGTDDSGWRVVNLPHDFVVEGDPSEAADKSHGYLPYSKAWYRKHISLPAAAAGSTIWIDVEGAQTTSEVYLNGVLLGTHGYGYTPNSYWVNSSVANYGGDNLLAIFVDATTPVSADVCRPTPPPGFAVRPVCSLLSLSLSVSPAPSPFLASVT